MIITLQKGTFTGYHLGVVRRLADEIAALGCVASIKFDEGNPERPTFVGQPAPGEVLVGPNRAERRAKR